VTQELPPNILEPVRNLGIQLAPHPMLLWLTTPTRLSHRPAGRRTCPPIFWLTRPRSPHHRAVHSAVYPPIGTPPMSRFTDTVWSPPLSMPRRPHSTRSSTFNGQYALHREAAISDPLLFAYSTLMAGTSSIAAVRLLLQLGIPVPSKKQFHAARKIVCDRIHTLASESVRRASEDVINGDWNRWFLGSSEKRLVLHCRLHKSPDEPAARL
jgi:hypothetical protein